MSFAALMGLGAYIDYELEQNGYKFAETIAQSVMLQTMFSECEGWDHIQLADKVDVVCCILDHGGDPNQAIDSPSLWQCCLQQISGMICIRPWINRGRLDSRRDRRRASSPRTETREKQQFKCLCSQEDFESWSQLILACVRAGAKHIDVQCLTEIGHQPIEEQSCIFHKLCHRLFSEINATSSSQKEPDSDFRLQTRSLLVPEISTGRSTSYGDSTLSDNARAHFGDEYKVYINNYHQHSDKLSLSSGFTSSMDRKRTENLIETSELVVRNNSHSDVMRQFDLDLTTAAAASRAVQMMIQHHYNTSRSTQIIDAEIELANEVLFEESSSYSPQRTQFGLLTCEDNEDDDLQDILGLMPQVRTLRSSTPAQNNGQEHIVSTSLPVNFKKNQRQSSVHDITSGSEHYMKSFRS